MVFRKLCTLRKAFIVVKLLKIPCHSMPYEYKREPLTSDEASRLASCCETH